MNKIIISIFALLPMLAMAQMTPEAIIANAPALPTAEEWGAKGKHSDAFKAKMKDRFGTANAYFAIDKLVSGAFKQ